MNRTTQDSLQVGTTEDSSVVAPTVRERPILFSAPMVRAILEGRKTQTRRVMKPQPEHGVGDPADSDLRCPYGMPGDRLWVKETWQAWQRTSYECDEWYLCDGPPRELRDRFGDPEIEYKATSPSLGPWRPSIFMPRWASRITLEVVSVRVERLHDISEEGAMQEGACELPLQVGAPGAWWRVPGTGMGPHRSARAAFKALWESINGADSWNLNPWVWVVEFERCREAA